MRAAPAVRARSCSAGAWVAVHQLLYGLAFAVAAYWLGAHLLGSSPGLGLTSLLTGGAAALAARRLVEPPMELAWDGAAWSLRAAKAAPLGGQAALMIDLGDWMLVRFVALEHERPRWRRVRWVPLSRAVAGADWSALRIALYHDRAPARPGGPYRVGPSA